MDFKVLKEFLDFSRFFVIYFRNLKGFKRGFVRRDCQIQLARDTWLNRGGTKATSAEPHGTCHVAVHCAPLLAWQPHMWLIT